MKNNIFTFFLYSTLLLIFLCIIFLVYVLKNIEIFNFSIPNIFFYILFPIIILFLSLYFLIKKKINLQLSLLITIFFSYLTLTIYCGFFYQSLWKIGENIKEKKIEEEFYKSILSKNDKVFDQRSKLEYLFDERNKNKEIYVYIPPSYSNFYQYLNKNFSKLRFLGSISNKDIVYCMRSGQWLVNKTDNYGFNNPIGSWKKDKIDLAILGDSYMHSSCQKKNKDISRILESKLNINLLNFGLSNIGFQHYLAITVEYLRVLKPKNVLLVVFEGNDLNFKKEFDEVFSNYLNDDNFSQNLFYRQDEIDEAYKNIHRIEKENSVKKNIFLDRNFKRKLIFSERQFYKDVFLLRPIRQKLNLHFSKKYFYKTKFSYQESLSLVNTFLSKINKNIKSWNGNLFVAYIPVPKIETGKYLKKNSYNSKVWKNNKSLPHIVTMRKDFPNLLNNLEINFIDTITPFEKHDNPKILIDYIHYHFSDEGYNFFAEIIIDSLKNNLSLN